MVLTANQQHRQDEAEPPGRIGGGLDEGGVGRQPGHDRQPRQIRHPEHHDEQACGRREAAAAAERARYGMGDRPQAEAGHQNARLGQPGHLQRRGAVGRPLLPERRHRHHPDQPADQRQHHRRTPCAVVPRLVQGLHRPVPQPQDQPVPPHPAARHGRPGRRLDERGRRRGGRWWCGHTAVFTTGPSATGRGRRAAPPRP